jgi:hypothetical protein
MAGIIANYVFAYGFITDISNPRYFEESTIDSDMKTVKIKKRYRKFLNEVGWFCYDTTPDEQSKLFVFGERILAVEDESFWYMDKNPDHSGFYNIQEDILNANLKYNNFIDAEAKLNNTHASFLFFMNDKCENNSF